MNFASHLKRLFQIARVCRRHGLDEYLKNYTKLRVFRFLLKLLFRTRRDIAVASRGVCLRDALQELGPIFIKFGQIMSTRPDIFPDDVIQELNLLQDQVPPFKGAEAREIVEKSLGSAIGDVFSEFKEAPVASASVAQVHAARLLSGEDVVVKVLRPGIEAEIDRDIKLLYMLARLFMRVWPNSGMYRAVELVHAYEHTLRNGLDLMIESANASRFRASFENEERIQVPRVYWEFTSTAVMVMEKVGGIPIRDVQQLRQAGIDLQLLAENGVGLFFEQAFHDGFFHGDLHPGNIFVSPQGQFVIVDFGIMGTLTATDRHYLAENLMAILRRDYRTVAEAHLRAGWAPRNVDIEQFEIGIRTVMEPIFDKSVGEISFANLLGRLFRTAREFGIPMQPQLLLFQKTFLNLEGLARMLHPELDLWTTGKPHIEKWVREKYSVQSTMNKIRSEAPYWLASMPELPQLAHEVLTNIRENQTQSGRSVGSASKIETVYRRVVFALLGVGSAVITAMTWVFYPGNLLFFIALIVTTGFFAAAWPRKSDDD